MTDEKSTTPFAGQLLASQSLDLAAFHLYEIGRSLSTEPLPAFYAEDVADMRRDAKYRAMGAHRRSIQSCRTVCIERIALALALLDGYIWPACTRGTGIIPNAGHARIRHRFRHEARTVFAEVFSYLEHDTDTEEQRAIIVEDLKRQHAEDTALVADWRKTIGLPSTVTQIHEDSER